MGAVGDSGASFCYYKSRVDAFLDRLFPRSRAAARRLTPSAHNMLGRMLNDPDDCCARLSLEEVAHHPWCARLESGSLARSSPVLVDKLVRLAEAQASLEEAERRDGKKPRYLARDGGALVDAVVERLRYVLRRLKPVADLSPFPHVVLSQRVQLRMCVSPALSAAAQQHHRAQQSRHSSEMSRQAAR